MLEIESYGNNIKVQEADFGYVVDFTIKYDTDNDDTVSYTLKSEECVKELDETMAGVNLVQILTDDINIELLIGASKIGAKEVFFSLNDYGNNETVIGTSKTYRININKEVSNFEIFNNLVILVSKDMAMAKDDEDEYKPNSIKH